MKAYAYRIAIDEGSRKVPSKLKRISYLANTEFNKYKLKFRGHDEDHDA